MRDVLPAILLPAILLPALAVAADPGGAPPPAPEGFAWEVQSALSDEFDGTVLDVGRWMPRHAYWNGREPSRFDPANVSLQDGCLVLRSTTRLASLEGVAKPEKEVWVQAACISSLAATASYGFYAARLQASRLSMTSSFWFQGKYSEIDVVEQVGASLKHPDQGLEMLMNTHWFADGWKSDKATPKKWRMPTQAADGFHVYGVWWKDERTVWMYHDGVKVAELSPAGAFKEPQYLFFDTEVFTWEGLPTIDSLKDAARNAMRVDWVRAWRLVPAAAR